MRPTLDECITGPKKQKPIAAATTTKKGVAADWRVLETSADKTNIAHDNLYELGELWMVYFNLRWWPTIRLIATLGVGEPLIKDEGIPVVRKTWNCLA